MCTCIRLPNPPVTAERQRDWVALHNGATESVNQDQNLIYHTAESTATPVRPYSAGRTIPLTAFLPTCPTYPFDNCTSTLTYLPTCSATSSSDCTSILLITALLFSRDKPWNIRVRQPNRRVLSASVQKSSELLDPFDTEPFNLPAMKSPMFASPSSRYPDCNITLGISHSITTSIPPPLKSLFTYDERLASLKPCLRFLETPRHSKAVMTAADFSGDDCDSDPNYMQCFTCSLLLYSEYFTPEPLKKHLHETPHCPLAIQLQQEKVAEEKIVAKPKIESPSAPPVKPLSTYEERLATLTNWFWSASLSRETVTAAEFRGINDRFRARCTHCLLMLSDTSKNPFKKHLEKSPECPLVLQLETTELGTPEAIAEASKPTPVAADIGFFDPTLLCDIQEFGLHHETTSFCQHLQNIRANYREADLIQLLHTCFRDSALTWYKKQSEIESETAKKGLSEWLEALTTAFPAKSSIQTPSSAPPTPPPPQYHSCLNCSASFSSLTRLLQHAQTACQKAVCKQCAEAFESKNKLHEHIRQHHVKPSKEVVKDASGRSSDREEDKISPTISSTTSPTTSPTTSSTTSTSTPPTTPKTTPKFSISRPVTPPERPRNPPTPLAIPAAMAPLTPNRSSLPLPTLKSIPKRVETASTTCPLPTPPATPSKLRKSISKPHLTIDDLVRMFREKLRPFDLPQHQNRRSSSQCSGARQSYQSRITAYFLPAANQKPPISQGLKSPKSKSFQQHTSAESLSLYRSALPEKSVFSSYKMADIFYISLQPTFSSRFSFLQSRFSFAWSSHIASSSLESSSSDLHVCCSCFDHFSFRHDLFNYRRRSQRYPSNRRSIEEIWER